MSLTETDAITQIRGFLNEATAVYWTDAELLYWLREGVRDFSSKTLMIEGDGEITLVASQLSYDASDAAFIATVIEPYAAIYTNTAGATYTGLMKMHPRKIGNLLKGAPGKPAYYALHNRKIYVWPLANATEVAAGAKIVLLYAQVTEDIADIEDEYQHIPILYAKAMAKMKDQKFQEASVLLNTYMSMASFERTDKHGREEDTLDMFKVNSRGGEQGAK